MGDNGIVLVIRSSNSKNTLEEFHEFFGNFKPNNSTARVEVIDQSVLEPFWRFQKYDHQIKYTHRVKR